MAPGDMREAFLDAVEVLYRLPPGAPISMVEVRNQTVPLSTLCGLLWNASDTLPGLILTELDDLGFRGRGTYGAAARWLKRAFLPNAV
jgi:hypothetical protein